MKRVLFVLTIVVSVAITVLGASFTSIQKEVEETPAKKNCVGYTIIEAGKGINCNGDTIALRRHNGFYEAVAQNK